MCRKLMYLVSFTLLLGLVLNSVAQNTDPSLVGWWKFEEASGTLYDQSDNHNDSTSSQGVLYQQTGQSGYALGFDGIDDYIVIGANGRPTDTFSFGGWFKTSSTHEIDPESISGVGGVNNQRYAFDPQHGGESNGGAGLSVGTNGILVYEHGSNYMPATAVYQADIGDDWNHIMVVYNNKQPTIYLNGSAVRTGFSSPREIVSAPIQFGGMVYGYFEGLMDEVRIYNRVLSAAEIKKLAARPNAWGPTPTDGTLYIDTWVSLSWSPGGNAATHDVYLGDNFDDVTAGTESVFQGNHGSTFFVVGFPGFPYPDGLVPGTTYYWRIDEVNDTEPNSPWKGKVWSFSIPPKTAYAPDPANGAESIAEDAKLSWTAGFGSKLHYVYFGDNFDDVNSADGGAPTGTATYTPGPLKLAKTYYWRIDEFDIIETHKGNVWSFTTQGGVAGPNPANGAVDVKQTPVLTWSPGVYSASHQVYFGTDKEAVRNADTGSPEYKGAGDLGSESSEHGKLEWNTTYYWRIDEINNDNPDSPWTGPVWSFTTANFLIVDDFESYNDLDPADPENNRIFNAWIDGYGIPTNGSLVGYDNPPFAEQTIVHSGNQSMPLFYDNSVGYSEATLMLTYPRDWTENGVSTLTIWFRGNSANAAETLYVALNGSAVVNHDNPNAAQVTTWTEWTIDLQAFADQGVNLANVNTIALGLGNKNSPQAGGSGTMYFDDIRLYAPAP
ncbi:MAG TPA: LamG domain-containing protein [Sedimentisphaerales bacterium]|nr:LamG domain-containing protein [Sedimentisphaerales bacterium]